LIVGRRGAGLVERMVIGSVADRLAHHAPCPLVIVP
jgi:nucleotide-binding universal stress UspA family protein